MRRMHCSYYQALVASFFSLVTAHGFVRGVVVDGVWYPGYNFVYQWQRTPPIVIGWSIPDDKDTGFIDGANYTNPDIICHRNATPAPVSASVRAGDVVELQWTDWPVGHHGPVIDYLAKCPDDCSNVDKTELEFFKISGVGLLDDTNTKPPGYWASDQLISNNNSWSVTIPPSIAPGNYVLRHEIIALHASHEVNGAQNYPQCVNLEITSDGTDVPAGVLGTELYKPDQPGISLNIYTSLSTYVVPGPSMYSGAVKMSQSVASVEGYATVSSSVTSTSQTPTSTASATKQSTTSFQMYQAPPPSGPSTDAASSVNEIVVVTTVVVEVVVKTAVKTVTWTG